MYSGRGQVTGDGSDTGQGEVRHRAGTRPWPAGPGVCRMSVRHPSGQHHEAQGEMRVMGSDK